MFGRFHLRIVIAIALLLIVSLFTISALIGETACAKALPGEPCSGSFILSSGVFTVFGDNSISPGFQVSSGVFTLPTPTPSPTISVSERKVYLPVVSRQNPPTATPVPAAHWQQLSGSVFNANALAVSNGKLFVAARSGGGLSMGLYQTQGCAVATTFTPVLANVEGFELAFNNAQAIMGTRDQKVYYSVNGGDIWMPTASTFLNNSAFSVVFTGNNRAYAATDDGLYESIDNGVSWLRLAIASPSRFNALTYDAANNQLWVGTYDKGVWSMTPGSTTLSENNSGLPDTAQDRRIYEISVQGADLYIGTANGVYHQSGSGSWAAHGLSGIIVLSLEAVKDQLYAGTGTPSSGGWGIWHRPLNGTHDWVQETDISPTLTVRDLYYDTSVLCKDAGSGRNALLAATLNGVWVYR